MKFIAVTGCVILAASLIAAAPAFKSMTMDLPPDAGFPDGPNVKTVNQNCLACHSADMVLTSLCCRAPPGRRRSPRCATE